ncbi:hypothetical protein GOBAR_DD00408 [Gossypium barbadense]|nr:hypothetical protein GOBAR_DD00408 [Gossypium barbadense]
MFYHSIIMFPPGPKVTGFMKYFQIFFTPGQDKFFICGQMGHIAANCEGKAKRKEGEFDEKADGKTVARKPYQGYYRRGAAYLAMGKFKEALKDFQQVLRL